MSPTFKPSNHEHPKQTSPQSSSLSPSSTAAPSNASGRHEAIQKSLGLIQTSLFGQQDYARRRRLVLAFPSAMPQNPSTLPSQFTSSRVDHVKRVGHSSVGQSQQQTQQVLNQVDSRGDWMQQQQRQQQQQQQQRRQSGALSESRHAYENFVATHMTSVASSQGNIAAPSHPGTDLLVTKAQNVSDAFVEKLSPRNRAISPPHRAAAASTTSPTFVAGSSPSSAAHSSSLAYSKAFRAKVLQNLNNQLGSDDKAASRPPPSNGSIHTQPLNVVLERQVVPTSYSLSPTGYNFQPTGTHSEPSLTSANPAPLGAYIAVQRLGTNESRKPKISSEGMQTSTGERERSPRRVPPLPLGHAPLPWQAASESLGPGDQRMKQNQMSAGQSRVVVAGKEGVTPLIAARTQQLELAVRDASPITQPHLGVKVIIL